MLHKNSVVGKADLFSLCILFALGALLFASTPTDGDFWWYDASRHAMNGVFLRDFFFEGGLTHPLTFASSYYKQYPGINIGFYPPFFYLSSVPFLAIFGAHHAVSQAVVSLYAVAVAICTFLICRRHMPRLAALCSAVCVIALPSSMLWSRQVQLDIPALALLMATAYCLIRHLEHGSVKWLYAAAIALALCLSTRVQCIFAVPAMGALLFFVRYENRPAASTRVAAMLVTAVLAAPALVMTAYFGQINQAQTLQMVGMPPLWSFENWTWYARLLPGETGWPALCVVIAGLVAALFVKRRPEGRITPVVASVFLVFSWVFFSVVSNKEARFNLPSLPFLFIFSAIGLHARLPRVATAVFALLAAWLCVQAWLTPVPVVSGFREAALMVQRLNADHAGVLISAHRDGSFIYDMRTYGRRRDIPVVRSDKVFVDIKVSKLFGVQDNHLDEQQVLSLLRERNIQTLVVQTGYLDEQPSIQAFQKMLDAGRYFNLVARIDMHGTTNPDEQALMVYARK